MTNREAMELYAALRPLVKPQADAPNTPTHLDRIVMDDVEVIRKMAQAFHRIATNQCNRELTRREIKEAETREQEGLVNIASRYRGILFSTSGDPRGYVLHIHFPDGRYNTMGGPEDGYGVAA